MKSILRIAVILLALVFLDTCMGGSGEGLVLIYSSRMPGFAQGISDIIANSSENGYEVVVVEDASVLSCMLPMPDVECVILPVLMATEVKTLVEPMTTYFQSGGAAIGFQGCCSQSKVGTLARDVFPVYGNSTGSPTIKEGMSVNEYVRDESMEGFTDLPTEMDLVGQFFTYSGTTSREVIEPEHEGGDRSVLYRDRKSGAPLVIAYESDGGSRSVSFTGCFVRSREDARNYYGKLLGDENFQMLLMDSLEWTVDGTTRNSKYGSSYPEIISQHRERIQDLRLERDEKEEKAETRRLIMLSIGWIAGLALSIGLIYRSFRGTKS